MTKELLEQYPDIVAEMKELKQELRTPVTDTVSGSMDEFPYTQHAITIKGAHVLPDKRARLEMLEQQKEEIESFVNSLPVKQQRIVRMRVYQRNSWRSVAAKMGYKFSEASVKMSYKRLFE